MSRSDRGGSSLPELMGAAVKVVVSDPPLPSASPPRGGRVESQSDLIPRTAERACKWSVLLSPVAQGAVGFLLLSPHRGEMSRSDRGGSPLPTLMGDGRSRRLSRTPLCLRHPSQRGERANSPLSLRHLPPERGERANSLLSLRRLLPEGEREQTVCFHLPASG